MRGHDDGHPSRQDYDEFEASSLFCESCKVAKPVRKHLLMVLPEGNKYEYRCADCGHSVGSKLDTSADDFHRILLR